MRNSSRATKGVDRPKRVLVAIVLTGTLVAIAILLYLLVNPLLMSGISAFRPRKLNLEEARNYYALIAAAVGSAAGAVGVVMGAFYYFNRLGWETERAARERRRARLDDLYRRIEEIDELVLSMSFASSDDAQTLQHARKVVRSLSSFGQLLEAEADVSGMTDEQACALVRFYSYLERRCQAILERSRSPLRAAGVDLDAIDVDEYDDRLYDARTALQECGAALR